MPNQKFFIGLAKDSFEKANNELFDSVFSDGDQQCSAIENTIEHLEDAIQHLKEAKQKLDI